MSLAIFVRLRFAIDRRTINMIHYAYKQIQKSVQSMASKEQILMQLRLDKELRDAASSVYKAIGMDLPTAIRMFLTRSVAVGGLPFEGRIAENGRQLAVDR